MIPHRMPPGTTWFNAGSRRAVGAWLAAACLLGAAPGHAADLAETLAETAAEPVAQLVGQPVAETAEHTAADIAPVADSVATPDPLAGTPRVDPATTGPDAERILASMLPPRSDSPRDWIAPLEPLHHCGEPRLLPACVPPPPCHPALPPQPDDLVGVRGAATCGPIYGGPCAPRTGTHDDGPLPRLHRVPDRLFDRFYRSR